MTSLLNRKIVRIDEEKCNGCGECVPSCAEGAIQIIDGKARLVAENLCDGLGACLGECPMDAIIIEERPADAFDPEAVEQRKRDLAGKTPEDGGPGSFKPLETLSAPPAQPGGCPGSTLRNVRAAQASRPSDAPTDSSEGSRLTHWPVQLALVPPVGHLWQDADVLIAADCVPFAMSDFHESLLAGKSLAIACPKLDDMQPHVEKLARIFASNDIRSVTVAHMEVPCCTGIVRTVQAALALAGRTDLPVEDVTIGVDGHRLGGRTSR